jgi:hypothetical protein
MKPNFFKIWRRYRMKFHQLYCFSFMSNNKHIDAQNFAFLLLVENVLFLGLITKCMREWLRKDLQLWIKKICLIINLKIYSKCFCFVLLCVMKFFWLKLKRGLIESQKWEVRVRRQCCLCRSTFWCVKSKILEFRTLPWLKWNYFWGGWTLLSFWTMSSIWPCELL